MSYTPRSRAPAAAGRSCGAVDALATAELFLVLRARLGATRLRELL